MRLRPKRKRWNKTSWARRNEKTEISDLFNVVRRVSSSTQVIIFFQKRREKRLREKQKLRSRSWEGKQRLDRLMWRKRRRKRLLAPTQSTELSNSAVLRIIRIRLSGVVVEDLEKKRRTRVRLLDLRIKNPNKKWTAHCFRAFEHQICLLEVVDN